jgi:hypothetical protein
MLQEQQAQQFHTRTPLPDRVRAPVNGSRAVKGETVILVACLLLPVLAALLYTMSRIEEWLARTAQPPRHARRRHLYLIPGGKQDASTRRRSSRRHRRLDAA